MYYSGMSKYRSLLFFFCTKKVVFFYVSMSRHSSENADSFNIHHNTAYKYKLNTQNTYSNILHKRKYSTQWDIM